MSDQKNMGDYNPDVDAAITIGNQQQHTVNFEWDGKRGPFTFRRPSLQERLIMGVYEANLLGNTPRASLDMPTQNIARMMATFKHVLVSSPQWFNIDKCDDYEMMEALYEKYLEVVRPFRRKTVQADQEAGKG